MLFERWIRQFAKDGLRRIADLRRMAMNGSEQNRRLLIRVDDLDARTLEVLAKQGPDDIRLAVAHHKNLHEDLARSLVANERIHDTAFKAALTSRLAAWQSEAQAAPDLAVAARTRPATDLQVPIEAPSPRSRPPIAEPAVVIAVDATTDTQVATDALTDDAAPTEVATAPEEAPVQFEEAEFTTQAAADTWAAPLDVGGLDPAQLDLLEAITFGEDDEVDLAEPSHAAAPDLDEQVERIVFDILEGHGPGLAEGPALDALRDKIAAKQPGPLIQSLRRLVREGFDPDVIVLAYALRAHWHASHVENGNRYTYLDWHSAVTLVGAYDGLPDLDEAIQVLEKLGHEWKATGCARSISEHLQSSMEDLKTYKDHGGTLPPDFFLQ